MTKPFKNNAAPFVCLFCGHPSWVDPSDQCHPQDYCHEIDHAQYTLGRRRIVIDNPEEFDE